MFLSFSFPSKVLNWLTFSLFHLLDYSQKSRFSICVSLCSWSSHFDVAFEAFFRCHDNQIYLSQAVTLPRDSGKDSLWMFVRCHCRAIVCDRKWVCVWVRERERESNAFDVCATSVQSVCVCGCVVVVVCVCYTLRERERSKDTLLTKCLLSKKSRAGHGTL